MEDFLKKVQNSSVADPVPASGVFLPLDPGCKKSGSGIRDEHPGSYFRELIKHQHKSII
jgi:hypothetical protein